MVLKMNKIIFLLVAVTICSCEREINPIVAEKFFNVSLIEEITYVGSDMPIISLTRNSEYLCTMNNTAGFYDGENRFMYSWNKDHHYLNGNDLEIVFTRDRYCPINGLRPENCLIGAKLIKNKLMAYYILWQNEGIKPELDSNKSYGRYFSSYYDKKNDTTIRDFFSMNSKFKWEISEHTDTLVTNLDVEVIHEIFPSFKGKYSQVAIDTILLNYDLAIESYDFYTDIRFKNYELGFSRNYHRLREFIKNEQKYLP